ncbi:hypothetical protein WAK64_06390 [Bacillus spongiae]|uniref:Glycosyl hydrolase n=1 Tax=Bacillus spongiae TaxID=2683610 RepID=A0ABU8HBM8_9BACI
MKKIRGIILFLLAMNILSLSVLADGNGDEHKSEIGISTYLGVGAILSLVLLVIGLILWNMTRKKLATSTNMKKNDRDLLRKKMSIQLMTSVIAGAVMLAATIGWATTRLESDESLELKHIHGLGYSADGDNLYIAAHDGVNLYAEDTWSNLHTKEEQHDFMGFSMVDEGFYSSGHPAPGSSLGNPFGVIKSDDMGESLKTLDLSGEMDFHEMAVGYNSHAIYVLNPEPNSRMDEAGVYYSIDEASTWEKSEMNGLEGAIRDIAVHPTEEEKVVVVTEVGAFYSEDFGNQFEPLVNATVTSTAFDQAGKLFMGIYEESNQLVEFDISTKEQKEISIPSLKEEDAIAYITVNPQKADELTFATFKKDVFQTKDMGGNWQQLADLGITKDKKEE